MFRNVQFSAKVINNSESSVHLGASECSLRHNDSDCAIHAWSKMWIAQFGLLYDHWKCPQTRWDMYFEVMGYEIYYFQLFHHLDRECSFTANSKEELLTQQIGEYKLEIARLYHPNILRIKRIQGKYSKECF